jgi:hypothetical protein
VFLLETVVFVAEVENFSDVVHFGNYSGDVDNFGSSSDDVGNSSRDFGNSNGNVDHFWSPSGGVGNSSGDVDNFGNSSGGVDHFGNPNGDDGNSSGDVGNSVEVGNLQNFGCVKIFREIVKKTSRMNVGNGRRLFWKNV